MVILFLLVNYCCSNYFVILILYVLSSFYNPLYLIDFLLYVFVYVCVLMSVPRAAMFWSVICYCGISLSISHVFNTFSMLG